jgi:hypothetical protein
MNIANMRKQEQNAIRNMDRAPRSIEREYGDKIEERLARGFRIPSYHFHRASREDFERGNVKTACHHLEFLRTVRA